VERLPKPDQARAVAAAVAQDLNDELTVILTSVTASVRALEPGHPARRLLFDLECAALRCASRASRLLEFSARRGGRAVRAGLDTVLES
jgi:hypothetical protein